MKKRLLIVALFLLLALVLTGCACMHEWTEATCLTPKTCSVCALTEGEALGHSGNWVVDGEQMKRTCTTCAAEETAEIDRTVIAESLLQGEWSSVAFSAPSATFDYANEYGSPVVFLTFAENRTGSIFVNFAPPPFEEFVWELDSYQILEESNDPTEAYLIQLKKDNVLLLNIVLTINTAGNAQIMTAPLFGVTFILEENTSAYAREGIDTVFYKQNFIGSWTSENSAYELTISDGYEGGDLFGAELVVLTPSEALCTDFSQFFPEETDSAQIIADNPSSYFIQSNYGLMLPLNEDGNLIFNDGSGTEIVFTKNPPVEE